MSQPEMAARQAAETYQQYMVPAIFEPWTEVLLQHVRLRPGERVLDVACGTGVVARHVAGVVGPTGTVAALDLNPAMLAVARAQPAPTGALITWHQGSALTLPFPDASFDVVLCQQGLQFFPDRALGVREMRRVLAPGGRVALSVWQAIEANGVYDELNEAIKRRMGIPAIDLPFSLGDANTLRELLHEAGFTDIAVIAETRSVRFPTPDRFVELLIQGAAAAVPMLAQMDAAARSALVERVRGDVAGWLQAHTEDGMLVTPMATNIALASV
jgi:ubiquinone/menaquinone biosynthesis C-methylase UbiE